MNIQMQARTLAMASLLAVATLSIPAVQAYAKPKANPTPVMCAMYGTADGISFYFPGEIYQGPPNPDGTPSARFICGADGQWHTVSDVAVGHSGTSTSGPATGADPATLAIP